MHKTNHTSSTGPAVVLAIAALLALGWVLPAQARRPAPAQASQGIDVVVVLDDSGSMATCWPWTGPARAEGCVGNQNPPSDPHALRYSAARLLVQLAGSEDRVAVIRFNAAAEGVIGQLQRAGNPAARQALLDAIKPLNDYTASGGYTRFDLALKQARGLLAAAQDENRPRYVLLLTDGVPTQPDGVPGQQQAVRQMIAELAGLGAQVLPVELCNEKAGCPDDTFIKQTMGRVPDKARTAGDLLQVFSGLYAQMQPGLHVIEQSGDGQLTFSIRPEHGARRLVIVTGKNAPALTRDGNPEAVTYSYQDDNVLLNVVEESQGLGTGKWSVETQGRGGFAVVQTDTYPELAFPPPAIAGSAAAPYYVPAGKPVAILANVAGPGAGSPVRLADGSVLKPFAPGERSLWTVLPGAKEDFSLQVGDDSAPLQILRTFRIVARPDLPTLLAVSPTATAPCPAGAACPLRAAFGPGAEISATQGLVYALDQSDGGKLVYSGPMICSGRTCTDPADNFKRLDGHRYTLRYLVQAHSGGEVFGDWAETTLVMGPAIRLQGLPAALNLKTQPAGGWPVTVTVGTTQDLGQLKATLVLTRTEDNTAVADAQVVFNAGLPGAGEQRATLRVATPPGLRPGHYQGRIAFAVDKPPAGEQVQLPEPLAVSLALARPSAALLGDAVDFGSVLFDTSANFRINQTAAVSMTFGAAPFQVTPALTESTCPELSVIAGAPEAQGDHYRVPLTLRSSQPIASRTCSGTLALSTPSEDYEIQGRRAVAWRLVIPAVEWQVTGVERGGARASDLAFGSLGRPGERSSVILLVRYTGQPPFALDMQDLQGAADGGRGALSTQDAELVTGAVTPQANTPDVYRVPVDLVVRRSLPQTTALAAWLAGTDYSGKLQLAIAGLPDGAAREVSFRLHNPSLYQRYVAPIYAWWWPGLVTCPLSILLPLAVLGLAWLRKKNADVEQILAGEREPAGPAGAEGTAAPAPGRPPGPPGRGPQTGNQPAYMLYGRPASGKSYQVPERPPRTAARPARGSTPASGPPPPKQAGPGSGAAPGAPPVKIPPRPSSTRRPK